MIKADQSGYLAHRKLSDGRIVGVIPLTYSRARIVITDDESGFSYGNGW